MPAIGPDPHKGRVYLNEGLGTSLAQWTDTRLTYKGILTRTDGAFVVSCTHDHQSQIAAIECVARIRNDFLFSIPQPEGATT